MSHKALKKLLPAAAGCWRRSARCWPRAAAWRAWRACTTARRGAHTFFLKAGRVERWGGYTVNLLHYEDAALLAAAVRAAGTLRSHSRAGCHP